MLRVGEERAFTQPPQEFHRASDASPGEFFLDLFQLLRRRRRTALTTGNLCSVLHADPNFDVRASPVPPSGLLYPQLDADGANPTSKAASSAKGQYRKGAGPISQRPRSQVSAQSQHYEKGLGADGES